MNNTEKYAKDYDLIYTEQTSKYEDAIMKLFLFMVFICIVLGFGLIGWVWATF